MRRMLGLCPLVLLIGVTARGATLVVPDDYATIRSAIDAAVHGDEILVRPGRPQVP